MDPVVQFNPALEPEGVEDAILTQDPWTLTSNIPWMVGFNEFEGGLKVSSKYCLQCMGSSLAAQQ